MTLQKLSCRCKNCGKHFRITKTCTSWSYDNAGILEWLMPNKKKHEDTQGLAELMPHCPACGSLDLDTHQQA